MWLAIRTNLMVSDLKYRAPTVGVQILKKKKRDLSLLSPPISVKNSNYACDYVHLFISDAVEAVLSRSLSPTFEWLVVRR
jgi:hypothetical protein